MRDGTGCHGAGRYARVRTLVQRWVRSAGQAQFEFGPELTMSVGRNRLKEAEVQQLGGQIISVPDILAPGIILRFNVNPDSCYDSKLKLK